MIGVRCRRDERAVAREFFELFKTPWELYERGHSYDVVIATDDSRPNGTEARLVIVFGAAENEPGTSPGLDAAGQEARLVENAEMQLPLYGRVLGFANTEDPLLTLAGTASAVAVRRADGASQVVLCGYDLFSEVQLLLSRGQPVSLSHFPTLDLHIHLLRQWILHAGVPLVEIPPSPPGYDHMACLTHDVDFLGLRLHRGDHTMWGFVWRAAIGSLVDALAGRSTRRRLVRNWRALLSLPLVHFGLARDFWLDFDEYIAVEKDLGGTFFFIPFRGRPGIAVEAAHATRRGAPYDLADAQPWIEKLLRHGFEVGVHGIDAWIDDELGRTELERVARVVRDHRLGVRMHWLLFDDESFGRLDRAGFLYDATCGYNDTVGFRAGTHQVFRPLDSAHMMELPLHIQDTSLFYPGRMHLDEDRAWETCERLRASAAEHGGVLTLSWHIRSYGPERLWGGFYRRLVTAIRERPVWFCCARDVVNWFEQRRHATFANVDHDGEVVRIRLKSAQAVASPGLVVRVHLSLGRHVDVEWKDGNEKSVEAHVAGGSR